MSARGHSADVEHTSATPDIVDLVGIGFGPSNLGLAIALEELSHRTDAPTARFVEAKDGFAWHPGMLLPGSTMQISYLKDLATQRNPRSAYTFLNYLDDRGRLTDFINFQTFFPTRLEFDDYLRWCAARVDARVDYGTRATAVRHDGRSFVVSTEGGDTLRGRHVVVGGGLRARLPRGVVAGPRVFHNHGLLFALAGLDAPTHHRFAVIGAGQSAAEVVEYLHARYPTAEIHGVYGKYGFSPADDSPFANRIFDPAAVDDFHVATPEVRRSLLRYHRGTNYSAVDPELIESLYRTEYGERVSGARRMLLHNASRFASVTADDRTATLTFEHLPTGRVERLECDAVVFATGFAPLDLSDLLGPLYREVVEDADGPRVTRDYRLGFRTALPGEVYLQGGTEHTHGLTSSLLSNIAVRSGEIARSIAARTARVDA